MTSRKKGNDNKKEETAKAEKDKLDQEAEVLHIAEQVELRKNAILIQMSKDPITQYVEELTKEKETVEDPLVHPLIVGTVDEWSNIPQLVARYCIHT
jgi:hypothetical protein